MKKRFAKLVAMACVLTMFGSTAVMAANAKSYDFYLVAGQTKQTGTMIKQTEGSAYVDRSGPVAATTTLTVYMCNNYGIQKSEQKNIEGIGHVYLGYSGYGVAAGDSIALAGKNDPNYNGGRSISASGTLIP